MSRVRLYSLVLLAVAESSFRPIVLSTAASSSRLLLVNSWLASLAPGGVHDRHQVVGAEAPLDELLRRDLHARRCGRSACADRRSPSRRRGRRTASRWSSRPARSATRRTAGGRRCSTGMSTSVNLVIACDFPSSRTWKSSFFRSRTMPSLLVGDDGVDLDVVDANLEGRRLLGGGRLAAPARGLAGGQRGAGQQHDQPHQSNTCIHGQLSTRLYVPARPSIGGSPKRREAPPPNLWQAMARLAEARCETDRRAKAAILEMMSPLAGGGRARHRRGAGGAQGRRPRRLAAVRLPRPEPDRRRRHRRSAARAATSPRAAGIT